MNYLLNVLLLSAFYYAIYKLMFARFSFLQPNRALLLALPILSFATPLLALLFPSYPVTILNPIVIDITIDALSETSISEGGFLWVDVALSFYLCITGVLCIRFLLRLRAIQSILKTASPQMAFGISHFISTKVNAPFSFLHAIVLPVKSFSTFEKEMILKHESVHVQQLHSLDNLYFSLITTLGWINPFFYLMAKELRQVHECQADAHAIKHTSRAEYAQMLLSQTLGTEIIFPAHAFFNSSLIKTRITMMYKSKTSSKMKWSYVLLLPAMALTVLYSCSKQEEALPENFAKVDSPPLFKTCDENATVDEQKICFQQEVITTVAKNFKYPESALALGMEGKVYYGLVVNSKGKVVDIEVKRGLTGNTPEEEIAAEDVNTEAIRVIKLIKDLKPAKLNGASVGMSFVLPMNLKLPVKEEIQMIEGEESLNE